MALIVLAACGGDESKAPLTLAQRVVAEEDAPGSKADPVEKRQQTAELNEFIGV